LDAPLPIMTKRPDDATRHAPSKARFACNLCMASFTRRYNLHQHLERHAGPRSKQHPCDLCPRAYYRKADLARHMRSHTR
ncbi:hypothetical protein BDK51DRAFT_13194, partial [Blyttiomyces helicus]